MKGRSVLRVKPDFRFGVHTRRWMWVLDVFGVRGQWLEGFESTDNYHTPTAARRAFKRRQEIFTNAEES